jgi:two-component sensor histidine kinase
MGDLARMRAKPWLTGASFMLLTVSLMVTSFMLWVVFNTWKYEKYGSYLAIYTIVEVSDLVISFFISLSILFLGQAITSYEIFTGNTLPRRGLFRNWLNTIFLSAAYSIIIGAGLVGRIAVIHYLMFTAFLMTGFYVMANKRFYIERERFMSELYPFVKTQNIYSNLLDQNENFNNKDNSTFIAMCDDILETEKAVLIPLGYFSSLINQVFYYPENIEEEINYDSIIKNENLHDNLCITLNPQEYNDLIICVPLWSEKGLSGLLFIGRKKDNGLYAQEEIEIARSISERILDIYASTQMAKTLVDTQRKKMTETKLIDNQTRRILHDDILPILHTSIIDLSSKNNKENQDIINNISQAHKKISNLLQNNGNDNLTKVSKSGLIIAIKDFIQKEMKNCFNKVDWDISNDSEDYLENQSITIKEVIFYAVREIIRNSAKYAKNEENNLILTIKSYIDDNDVKIVLEDNGQGINFEHKSESGSGQGLKIHSTMLAVIGGYISIESEKNNFTRVILVLPLTGFTQS